MNAVGVPTINPPSATSLLAALQQLNGNHYLSVTDRGPNLDRPDGFKAFPFPQFTPTIVQFQVINDQIVPTGYLPIVNNFGADITGLPNGPADDAKGYLNLTATTPLPFNPDGLDTEVPVLTVIAAPGPL